MEMHELRALKQEIRANTARAAQSIIVAIIGAQEEITAAVDQRDASEVYTTGTEKYQLAREIWERVAEEYGVAWEKVVGEEEADSG